MLIYLCNLREQIISASWQKHLFSFKSCVMLIISRYIVFIVIYVSTLLAVCAKQIIFCLLAEYFYFWATIRPPVPILRFKFILLVSHRGVILILSRVCCLPRFRLLDLVHAFLTWDTPFVEQKLSAVFEVGVEVILKQFFNLSACLLLSAVFFNWDGFFHISYNNNEIVPCTSKNFKLYLWLLFQLDNCRCLHRNFLHLRVNHPRTYFHPNCLHLQKI